MNRNLHHIITTIITVFISVTLYAAHTNAERLSLLQPLIQYDLAFNTGVTTDSIILWEKLLTPELEKQQRYDILFQLKAMAVQSSITEGNISLAIDNANSMYKKAKEIDYPLGTALALRAIGNTYLSSSTPQVAIGSYEEAIEIMQQIPEADIYLKNALSQMILIKLNNRQMAGIEKDKLFATKGPIHLAIFIFPVAVRFMRYSQTNSLRHWNICKKWSESMPNIRIHIFFC